MSGERHVIGEVEDSAFGSGRCCRVDADETHAYLVFIVNGEQVFEVPIPDRDTIAWIRVVGEVRSLLMGAGAHLTAAI